MYIFSFRFIHSARASQAQILPRVFVLLRGGVIYRIAHRVSHHARPFAPRRVHLSRSFIRAFAASRGGSSHRFRHPRHPRAPPSPRSIAPLRRVATTRRIIVSPRPRVRRRHRATDRASLVESNQNHIESIARFVRHERDRTRAPSSGNRSLAHASSTASTTRQSTRATESSMAVDECGRTNARRARTHHHPPTYTRHTYPINENIP